MKYLHIFSNASILVDYCFSDMCILPDTDGNTTSLREDFLIVFSLNKKIISSHGNFMAMAQGMNSFYLIIVCTH
jgi:hypothetical protein